MESEQHLSSEQEKIVERLHHPSVVERYFTRRYKTDIKKITGEDQCVLSHSNKICIITVAPSHPLITQKKEVVKLNFQVDDNTNRLENKVSGKGKRGAQWLTENAVLCKANCSDGTEYLLYSCMRGSLVEINENLVKDPSLLIKKPDTSGFIAVVLPRLNEYHHQMNKLLTQEQYEQVLKERTASKAE